MNNLSVLMVVTIAQCEDDLHEDLPDYILGNVITVCLALFYELSHVSVFTILHDNVDSFGFLVNYSTNEGYKSFIKRKTLTCHSIKLY